MRVLISRASSRSSTVSCCTRRATAAQREQDAAQLGVVCGARGRVAARRARSRARVSGRSSARSGSGVVTRRSRSWQRPARLGVHRSLTSGHQRPQRLAFAACCAASRAAPERARCGRPGQRRARPSCRPSAARVGSRPTSNTRSPLPVEEARQAGAVGAGALDRERTPTRRMRLGETERFRVAAAVGGHRRLEHDHTAPHLDDTDRVLDRGAGRHRPRSPADLQPSRSTSSPTLGDNSGSRSGDGNRGRHDCDGSHPTQGGQASDQASKRAPDRHRPLRPDTSLERHRNRGSFGNRVTNEEHRRHPGNNPRRGPHTLTVRECHPTGDRSRLLREWTLQGGPRSPRSARRRTAPARCPEAVVRRIRMLDRSGRSCRRARQRPVVGYCRRPLLR